MEGLQKWAHFTTQAVWYFKSRSQGWEKKKKKNLVLKVFILMCLLIHSSQSLHLVDTSKSFR